jgi:hypothetical protein
MPESRGIVWGRLPFIHIHIWFGISISSPSWYYCFCQAFDPSYCVYSLFLWLFEWLKDLNLWMIGGIMLERKILQVKMLMITINYVYGFRVFFSKEDVEMWLLWEKNSVFAIHCPFSTILLNLYLHGTELMFNYGFMQHVK